MSSPESTARTRELGRRLRSAQTKIELNGTQLAELLGWTPTMLSRTLSGRRTTLDVDVSAFLAVCQVTGEERRRILQLAHPSGDDPRFLRLPEEEQWSAYLAQAKISARLVEFQPFVIPSMLQTPDYTRALLSARETILASRLEQNFHARRDTTSLLRLPRAELFLHEWSLRAPLQDAGLMSEQLHHLLTVSVSPSISLRVAPVEESIHISQWSFVLLEFDDDLLVVYLEGATAGVFLDNGHEVNTYRMMVDHLDKCALNEQDSRTVISKIAMELYGEPTSEAGLTNDFVRSWIT